MFNNYLSQIDCDDLKIVLYNLKYYMFRRRIFYEDDYYSHFVLKRERYYILYITKIYKLFISINRAVMWPNR